MGKRIQPNIPLITYSLTTLVVVAILPSLLLQLNTKPVEQTDTPTPADVVLISPTHTRIPTNSPTPTPSRTPTPTATTTSTNTRMPTPTNTPTATSTPTNTPTPTDAPTPTPTGTFTPTSTPVATDVSSRITLIDPLDGSTFVGRGEKIVLQWEWDDALQEDDYFFVEAEFTGFEEGVCKENWLYFKWTKRTRFVVDPWLYDIICPTSDERTVRWTISVGQPTNGLQRSDRIQKNTTAGRRDFQWTLSSGENSNGNGGGDGGIVSPSN